MLAPRDNFSDKITGPFQVARKGSVSQLPGFQITETEGHPRSRKDGKRHEGGPFYTYRTRFTVPTVNVLLERKVNGGVFRYDGPIRTPWPTVPIGFMPQPKKYASTDWTKLDSLGTHAIAECAPTNSVMDLSRFLGELKKDGIPSLPALKAIERKADSIRRTAGNEFLNVEFGWLPLLDEIKEIRSGLAHSRDVINQYRRDSGRPVHREYHFPDERSVKTETETSTHAELGVPLESEFWTAAGATLTRTTETLVRRWFKGCFTYHIPETDSLKGILGLGTESDKLLGISPTPDTLWELSPWSWAIDWFSNAGDVITNLTEFGLVGLVMPYGYMMEETTSKITNELHTSGLRNSDGKEFGVVPPPATAETTVKVRRPANPFGFSMSAPDMSPVKYAIVTALGLSHLL